MDDQARPFTLEIVEWIGGIPVCEFFWGGTTQINGTCNGVNWYTDQVITEFYATYYLGVRGIRFRMLAA